MLVKMSDFNAEVYLLTRQWYNRIGIQSIPGHFCKKTHNIL